MEKEKLSGSDKELYWIFGVMLGIIVIFLIIYGINVKSRSLTYEDLDFQKEMMGQIPFYKYVYTTDKVTRTAGQVVRTGDTATVAVYLRNDPRDLESIPVEGKIEYLPREQYVYITIDSSKDVLCEYSAIAMAELSSFLTQNGYAAKAGVSNESAALEQNLEYISCENRPERMVIAIVPGESPSVVREGNCYTITVANCDILPPTERFIVQSILDARAQS